VLSQIHDLPPIALMIPDLGCFNIESSVNGTRRP
jgi:hypothetical protein